MNALKKLGGAKPSTKKMAMGAVLKAATPKQNKFKAVLGKTKTVKTSSKSSPLKLALAKK